MENKNQNKNKRNELVQRWEYSHAKVMKLPCSPKKINMAAKLVRMQNVSDALAQLKIQSNKSCFEMYKIVKSAFNNLKQKAKDIREINTKILRIEIGPGPVLKRMIPRARGNANVLRCKYSCVTVKVGAPNGE